MYSVHCCHSKTQPKGVATVINVAGLHATERVERVEKILEDLILAIKCYDTEVINVTSGHNSLARVSHLILTTIGETRKCKLTMLHKKKKTRYW